MLSDDRLDALIGWAFVAALGTFGALALAVLALLASWAL